jgi:hypothetical protein
MSMPSGLQGLHQSIDRQMERVSQFEGESGKGREAEGGGEGEGAGAGQDGVWVDVTCDFFMVTSYAVKRQQGR